MKPFSPVYSLSFHEELNPLFWDNFELLPKVEKKMLEIAQTFIEDIELELDIEDVTFTGSLANYNYTKFSDIDLHIVTDFSEYDIDKDIVKDYFDAKKNVWNKTHNISIFGYNVELYIQDIGEEHHSTGVYSLKTNEWLKEPSPIDVENDIDFSLVTKKVNDFFGLIDDILDKDCDSECANKIKDKFTKMRKAGLERCGEFSPENLAFKMLRQHGDIDALMSVVLGKQDDKLSLNEKYTKFKNYFSTSTKRGPHHRQLKAGVNNITRHDAHQITMIGQDHKFNDNTREIEVLKGKPNGIAFIDQFKALDIATRYGLSLERIKRGESKQLSTSNITISYNPNLNRFYLHKY